MHEIVVKAEDNGSRVPQFARVDAFPQLTERGVAPEANSRDGTKMITDEIEKIDAKSLRVLMRDHLRE